MSFEEMGDVGGLGEGVAKRRRVRSAHQAIYLSILRGSVSLVNKCRFGCKRFCRRVSRFDGQSPPFLNHELRGS